MPTLYQVCRIIFWATTIPSIEYLFDRTRKMQIEEINLGTNLSLKTANHWDTELISLDAIQNMSLEGVRWASTFVGICQIKSYWNL